MALEIERHASSRFTRGRKNEVVRAIEARDEAGLIALTRVYLETRGVKKNRASEHTHRQYAIGVSKLIEWAWGDRGRHVLQITEDDLDEFVLELSAEPQPLPADYKRARGERKPRQTRLSRSSLDVYLAGVRTFFKALLWTNAIASDPSLSLRSPRSERNTKRPTLSHHQMSELRAVDTPLAARELAGAAKETPETGDARKAVASKWLANLEQRRPLLAIRDAAIIELLYGGQLRAAELCSLRLGDLKLASAELDVTGKGDKRRRVLLSPAAVQRLEAWLLVRGELATKDSAGAVFVSSSNRSLGKPLGYTAAYELVKGRLRVLEEQIVLPSSNGEQLGKVSLGGVHTLRRSGATALYEITKDLRSLQVQLGHADIGTTADYVTESRAALRKGLDQLE